MTAMTDVFLLGPGIAIGLIVAVPIGPVNLICIRRTLQYGPLNGFISGLGAALGDGVFAIVTAFGLTAIAQLIEGLSLPLQIVGGSLLLGYGIYTYLAEPPPPYEDADDAKEQGASTLASAMASTFALTITNPATLFGFTALFTGLGGLTGGEPSYSSAGFTVAGVILGSTLWWLVLTSVVNRLHASLDAKVMRLINHIFGLAIGGFGLVVLGRLVAKFFWPP